MNKNKALTPACNPPTADLLHSIRRSRSRLATLVVLLASLLALSLTFVTPPLSHNFITLNDDAGANDEPGQKDLTRMGSDDSHAGTLEILWNWDITSQSGNNSADACALFDTNDDGRVNFSICGVWKDGAVQEPDSPRLYSCGDDKSDRCTQPITLINAAPNGDPDPSLIDSTCPTILVQSTDPFPTGDSYPNDAVANCSIDLDEVGGPGTTRLINVCSYPSQEPNSDPSDCVVTPGAGFLTIVKDATPDDSTPFPFALNPASTNGQSQFTITGSGSANRIPVSPTQNPFSLSESIPSGWTLTSASCVTTGGSPTGRSE